MMPSIRLSVLAATLMVAACSKGITEPQCDRCDEIRVITDRPEYRPGSMIAFTITNRTTTVMRYDWCSVALASRGNGDDFPPAIYNPGRRCGFGAGVDKVLEHAVVLQPGQSTRDSLSISGAANQSLYRLAIWLLDETGLPQQGNPVVSNTFDVYPGANSTVVR